MKFLLYRPVKEQELVEIPPWYADALAFESLNEAYEKSIRKEMEVLGWAIFQEEGEER